MAKQARATAPDGRLEKLLYRREEASFVLGLRVREIDRMVSEQVLSTRRYGRCILIPASDVRRVANTIMTSDMLQGAASGRQ